MTRPVNHQVNCIETSSLRGHPARFWYRESTTDLSTVFASFSAWGQPAHDEYALADLHPRRFLDIGGHIGVVTVAVLLDNPDATAVVIEPLPENVELLRRNLDANGVADRTSVIEGAVGTGDEQIVTYRAMDDVHRFVGLSTDDYPGAESVTVPTAHLSGSFDVVKIDCEGCEWRALLDPVVLATPLIMGEWHWGAGADAIAELLRDTHEVTVSTNPNGQDGNFRAVRR